MPDVPLALAVLTTGITAVATITAGAIPQIVPFVQNRRQGDRARQERMELERQRLLHERRKDCAALLRMARNFQVEVENHYEYSGPDKAARAGAIRQHAADITGQAVRSACCYPDSLPRRTPWPTRLASSSASWRIRRA